MPERRLIAKLLATSAVTTLCGTRVRCGHLVQSDVLPAVTITRVNTEPLNVSTGTTTSYFVGLQLNCFAASYTAAKSLATAVRGALSGYSDTTGDPQVEMCHLTGEIDLPIDAEGGADLGLYGVAQDYTLQLYPAT